MNKQQKKYLKKEAHYLKPIFQIGKEGISENLLIGLDQALTKHELIKIHVLKTAPQFVDEFVNQLQQSLVCEIIDTIGKVIVLYRKSSENIYEL